MNRREFLQRGLAAAGSLIAPQTAVAAPAVAAIPTSAAAASVIPASFPWMKDVWFPSFSSLEFVMRNRNVGERFEARYYEQFRRLKTPSGREISGFGEWTTSLLLWADGKTKKEIRAGIEEEMQGQIRSDGYNSIENHQFCENLLKLFDSAFSELDESHIFSAHELAGLSQQVSQVANNYMARCDQYLKDIEPVLKQDLLNERTEKFAEDPLFFHKLEVTPEVFMRTPYNGYLQPFKLKIRVAREANESPADYDQRTKDMAEFLITALCQNIELEQRGAKNGVIYLKPKLSHYAGDSDYSPIWPQELLERMDECLEKQQICGL